LQLDRKSTHLPKCLLILKGPIWIFWGAPTAFYTVLLTLYDQGSNMCITSQTYQKLSGDVILGNSGSAAGTTPSKLQDKTEYRLIKITLISSASHFNLGSETLFNPPGRRD